MTVPQNVFWAFFVVVAAIVVGGILLLFLRGERVGTMKVPGRYGLTLAFLQTSGSATRIRLTVAREGGAAPRIQLRVIASVSMYVDLLSPAEATNLAQLLETASSRLRAP